MFWYYLKSWRFVVVQPLSHVRFFATSRTSACQTSLSFTISRSLLTLMSIESMMPFNHLILCRPLLLLPSIFPSFRAFANELSLHNRWPKYWSFSFSISPSNEYSGLISFRIDWFDLLPCSPRDSQESSPTPQFKSIINCYECLFSYMANASVSYIEVKWKSLSCVRLFETPWTV